MPLLNDVPTTVSLNVGEKLLYTGSCSLQVSVVKADGSSAPLRSLPENNFFLVPVTGDYVLLVRGACCSAGDYEVFPAESAVPTPLDVSIDNWDDMPQGIEVSVLAGFCVYNDDDELIGKTFKCKIVDGETGDVTWAKKIDLIGAASVVDYDPAVHGVEAECVGEKSCEESEASGVVGWGD